MRSRLASALAICALLGACSVLTSLSDLASDGGQDGAVDASLDVQTTSDAADDHAGQVALSVTVVGYGPVTGTLSSVPAGVSCSGPCTTMLWVAPGTSVSLSLANALGTLQRWQGACTGTALMCDVVVNTSTTVTLTLNAWNYAFVTLATMQGNFGADGGAIASADAICAQAATNAAVPGAFKAYLSTDPPLVNADDRISSARGWIRVDGEPVFDSVEAMKDGQMLYPLFLDENGIEIPNGCAWTGTDTNGDNLSGCASDAGVPWTSNDNNNVAFVGAPVCETNGWVSTHTSTRCNTLCSLYCFGVDLDAPLPNPTPAPTRIAFVSSAVWSPSTGISMADAICASEAESANLSGSFQAMLSTTTQAAAARFDLTKANWARPDGVALATSPMALASGNAMAALDVHADGTYVVVGTGVAWTGATSPNLVGTAASTCSDWTEANVDAGGTIGVVDYASAGLFGAGVGPGTCSSSLLVYCFQE